MHKEVPKCAYCAVYSAWVLNLRTIYGTFQDNFNLRAICSAGHCARAENSKILKIRTKALVGLIGCQDKKTWHFARCFRVPG